VKQDLSIEIFFHLHEIKMDIYCRQRSFREASLEAVWSIPALTMEMLWRFYMAAWILLSCPFLRTTPLEK